MLLGLLAVARPAPAQETRTDLLRDLLTTLPAGILRPQAGPALTFYDREALLLATDRPGVVGTDDPRTPYRRLESLPNDLDISLVRGIEGDWEERIGFGPSDISGMLSYDVPPERITVFALADSVDFGPIVATLQANGYSAEARGDWQALWRGEAESGTDPLSRDPGDPFGGYLGRSSRLAVNAPVIAYAPAWPLIEAVLDEPAANLVALPQLGALLDALDDDRFAAAAIAQAIILTPLDPRIHDGRDDVIPPWQLAIFADLSTGGVDHGVLAFAYADADGAGSAAERVLTGIAEPGETGPPVLEVSGGQAEAWVTQSGALSVMVLDIRREMSGEADAFRNPGFSALLRASMMADLPFLRL